MGFSTEGDTEPDRVHSGRETREKRTPHAMPLPRCVSAFGWNSKLAYARVENQSTQDRKTFHLMGSRYGENHCITTQTQGGVRYMIGGFPMSYSDQIVFYDLGSVDQTAWDQVPKEVASRIDR